MESRRKCLIHGLADEQPGDQHADKGPIFWAKHLQELERISGLTSDQAKEQLLSAVKEDVKHETAMYVKEMETRAKEDARKKAKEYVVTAIQKCAVDHVAVPSKLTLDFSGVSFMDSSGIAVVMRALKRMRAMGGSAAIKSVPPQAKKVFTAAGIFRIVPLEEGEKSDESKTE